MTRVKGSTIHLARRKKVLKEAEGYFGSKHRLYKTAKEQLMHSGQYAYRDRRAKKRDFRKLWIIRINAACRENEISYSRFINGLAKAGIAVNRKMLSEIAINNPDNFKALVEEAKKALNGEVKKEVKAVKTEKVVKEVKEETIDLTKLTVAELKSLAEKKNVKLESNMKKADIIALLK